MRMSYWLRTSGLCIALALIAGCPSPLAPVTTVVIGNVRDAATDDPLVGARVSLALDAQGEASALSDADGRFELQFESASASAPLSVDLSASLEGYDVAVDKVEVVRGKTTQNSYALRMVPEGVSACIQKRRPAVIVGYFRPASGRPDPTLSDRIADTLRYNLLIQIQKANFAADAQPRIFPCSAAEPKVPERYGGYARLFGADAYVGGYVTSPDPVKVKVQIAVADGYGVLRAPMTATSHDVNLDDPQLAQLAPEANAAVLTALAIGYKLADKPQECIDLIAASERLLGALPDTLLGLREDCRAALPNRGLL
jgi:hypothetical protein